MKALAAVFIFLSVLWGGQLFAQVQAVHFNATVTEVFNQNGNGLALATALGIANGNSISGRYFFNPNHPDGSLDPNLGLYNNVAAPFIMNLETSSRLYSFLSSSNRITVSNQPTFDEIQVLSLAGVVSNLPAGSMLGQVNVLWNDPTAAALSGEALVAPPQFPWTFKTIRLLAFGDGSGNQFGLFAEIDNFSMAQGYLVTSTNDTGDGSLRSSIQAANGDGVASAIAFDPLVFTPTAPCATTPTAAVPAPGTIVLNSPLPIMTGAGDSIDGSGSCVVIDGRNLTVDSGNNGIRIRASDATVRGITVQNFSANDAVRIEGRDSSPLIKNVLIAENSLLWNRRGVQVTGGIGSAGRTVSATVSGNNIEDVENGIRVVGNATGDAGSNRLDILVDRNRLRRTFQSTPGQLGDGINIGGATDFGSNNVVTAAVSNNAIFDVVDDGITSHGCGGADTGENNFLDTTISNNDVKFFITAPNPTPQGIRNSGITVGGASGESGAPSFCVGNTVRFSILNNVVTGFPTRNINVSAGSIGTQEHDVQATVSANTLTNSRGNTGSAGDGEGIRVSLGAGTGHLVHDVIIEGNKISGNPGAGVVLTGASSTDGEVTRVNIAFNTIDGTPPKSPAYSIIPAADQDGILVVGSSNAINATLTDILLSDNTAKNNQRSGIRVTQGDPSNVLALTGIANNSSTGNSEDGITIRSGIPGTGATPISGNKCDNNGQDGMDINSPGYSLSNNSCSRNAGDGINGVVGNIDGGGNSGRRNGDCNQPSFCFNTPLS